ncbi:MAG: protein kinase [Planctomycetota bacterium]
MPESASSQTSADTMLGRIVVERGLATPEEVEHCNKQLSSDSGGDPNQRSLGDLLVEHGVATRKQIDRILPELEERKQQRQIPGYKMLERLGAGAMATVYRAKQVSLDRNVAIKILPKKFSSNKQFIERFYAEGKAAAKLNHPNIVGAVDVGLAGDTHYFVMEFVDGLTVYDELVKHGRYSEKRALEIAIGVGKALEHAHKAGFIHRDVKPKNIMITKQGVVKLADMGLARAVSDREAAEAEAGKAFGTPYYISPEQIRGEVDVDERADIYGLGCTLYHMVTGKVPFDGPNPSAVMHKHLRNEATPPDQINPELSNGLAEVVESAMSKDRKSRYASAADMLIDLEAVAKGEAPPQARKMVDFAALSAPTPDAEAEPNAHLVSLDKGPGLLSQPVAWVAIAGWAVSLLLLITVIVLAVANGG